MHPFHHAAAMPDQPAIIMANSGETLSYAGLEARSNQAARLYRACGLKRGDTIAIFLENHIDYLPLCWGAQRSGLIFTCISTKLTADEAGYIVTDCGAKLLVAGRLAGGGGEGPAGCAAPICAGWGHSGLCPAGGGAGGPADDADCG